MTWAAARPPESRSRVAREQAAAVGVGVPTRWATTMRSLLVAASAQEATSQGSGQELDCTTRALSSPSSSFSRALRATNSGSASRSRGAGGQRAAAGLSRARVSRIRARLAKTSGGRDTDSLRESSSRASGAGVVRARGTARADSCSRRQGAKEPETRLPRCWSLPQTTHLPRGACPGARRLSPPGCCAATTPSSNPRRSAWLSKSWVSINLIRGDGASFAAFDKAVAAMLRWSSGAAVWDPGYLLRMLTTVMKPVTAGVPCPPGPSRSAAMLRGGALQGSSRILWAW